MQDSESCFQKLHRLFVNASGKENIQLVLKSNEILDKYCKYKKYKNKLEIFFNTFAPGEKYLGKDLVELEKLWQNIKKWNNMTLK